MLDFYVADQLKQARMDEIKQYHKHAMPNEKQTPNRRGLLFIYCYALFFFMR